MDDVSRVRGSGSGSAYGGAVAHSKVEVGGVAAYSDDTASVVEGP